MQSANAGPIVLKLLRISILQQRNIKPSVVLCVTAQLPLMKTASILIMSYICIYIAYLFKKIEFFWGANSRTQSVEFSL